MRGTKLYAMLIAVFMAGAFLASPELRAYAANTIGSAEIINNSLQSVDIKDGEVKSADIATDAVGAAELQGVTKLLFGQCVLSSSENARNITAGGFLAKNCNISGVDSDDSAIALVNAGNNCFEVQSAGSLTNTVLVVLRNDCETAEKMIVGKLAVIVYDK